MTKRLKPVAHGIAVAAIVAGAIALLGTIVPTISKAGQAQPKSDLLFTDLPSGSERRQAVRDDIQAAAGAERGAIVAFLKACIAYDHEAYRSGRAAAQYHGRCKRAVDAWRLSHGKTGPRRKLDHQMAIFLKIIGFMTLSAARIDQAKCAQFGACSPEALRLFAVTNPADLDRLGAENHANFARSQQFVEGMIEIVQETR